MGQGGNRKPPPATPVNPSHPLAKGLVFLFPFNEGTGNAAYDVVTPGGFNCPIVRQTAGNPWVYPYFRLPTTSDTAQSGPIPPQWKINPPLTLIWIGRSLATPTNSTTIFGIIYASPNVSPYQGPVLFNSITSLQFGFNNAGTAVNISSGTSWVGGKRYLFGGMVSANVLPGTTTFGGAYVVPLVPGLGTQGSAVSTINYTSTSYLILQCGAIDTELAALYSRTLSTDELESLYANPYDMYASPSRNRRVFLMGVRRTAIAARRTLTPRVGSRGIH